MRLDLLNEAPALWLILVIGVAILVLRFWAGRRRIRWAPTVVRLLAVAGLVLPGWTILTWYADLSRAREWADRLNVPASADSISREFLVNSAVLLTLGFALLVVGIYVAHRLDKITDTDSGEASP